MTASAIDTPRLVLTPVSPDDAHEAYPAFADRGLYRWMVGEPPPDEAALRTTFERLAAGCPRPDELWLNWLARRRDDEALVGWHQATVTGTRADVAWVTFAAHRRCVAHNEDRQRHEQKARRESRAVSACVRHCAFSRFSISAAFALFGSRWSGLDVSSL